MHNTAGGNLYKTEKMKEMSENDVRFWGSYVYIIEGKITDDFVFYEFNALCRKEKV